MENRKTLTVTLETVTPLFLEGAEPRDKLPELRDRPPFVVHCGIGYGRRWEE